MERRGYTLCNKDAIQNTNRVFDNVKPKIVPMSIFFNDPLCKLLNDRNFLSTEI